MADPMVAQRRRDTWLGGLAHWGRKNVCQHYRRPRTRICHYLCFRRQARLDIELAAGDLAKILDAKFAESPAAIKHCAGCKHPALSDYSSSPHLSVHKHSHPAASFSGIRFQHFGINKAGIHIARFVIRRGYPSPPVALKFNVAIR